jgi:hypothetical protein
MEIDHAGRVAELIAERVKDLQLAAERRAIEVQLGEHTIFVEQAIAHTQAGGRLQLAPLVKAIDRKMQLGLLAIPLTVSIEQRQERVVVEVLKHQFSLPGLLEQGCKCGLPHANRPFDGEKDPGRHRRSFTRFLALV